MTLTAEENLTFAHQYAMKWYDLVQKNKGTEKRKDLIETVEYATKHVAEARATNPKVTIHLEGKNPDTWSVDMLTALVLYQEAYIAAEIPRQFSTPRPSQYKPKDNLRAHHAIETLQKAVSYHEVPVYYILLSTLYTRVFDRDAAIAAARKATEIDRSNLDARTHLTKLESNPKLGVMPSKGLFMREETFRDLLAESHL